MKKIVLILSFCFTLMFCAFACTKKSNTNVDDYNIINDIYHWANVSLSHKVVEEAILPTTHPEKGGEITWVSTKPEVISNDGKVLKRESKSQTVVFNVNIKLNGLEKDFEFTMHVSSMTFEEAEKAIKDVFPEEITESVSLPNGLGDGVIDYTITSSDEGLIGSCGCYNNPYRAGIVTMTYVIGDGYKELKGSFDVKVLGKATDEKFEITEEWIRSTGLADTYLTSETVLPTYYDETAATISWESSVDKILSKDNKITEYVYERYTCLCAKVEIDDEYQRVYIDCKVKAKDTSNMSKQELLENFIDSIAVNEYARLTFSQTGYIYNKYLENEQYGYSTDQTSSYGFLSFYTTQKMAITEKIAPLDSVSNHDNRPGTKKEVCAYICVHDTGTPSSNATAAMEANYVYGGGSGTSWHYTVDETSIYHQIPDDEVAYHAGDSAYRMFEMIDTGIKATAVRPYIKVVDGYYNINGVQTEFCPLVKVNTKSVTSEETDNPIQADINQQGIFCEIGENGNYWIGKTYYNATYKRIANYGGNRSSIGIESCVNAGHDYATTARNLAELVASLCIQNNLTVDRVKGHHYFSGKPCPNAILLAQWWSNFLDLVSLEKFGQEMFSDLTFTWTSNNSYMDNTGKIIYKGKVGYVLDYSVSVKDSKNNEIYKESFKTTLK